MIIPRKDWLALMKILREIKSLKQEWLSEKETCEILGIKHATLIGYVSKGRISPDMYRVGIGGTRFYDKEKIMGKPLEF